MKVHIFMVVLLHFGIKKKEKRDNEEKDFCFKRNK